MLRQFASVIIMTQKHTMADFYALIPNHCVKNFKVSNIKIGEEYS